MNLLNKIVDGIDDNRIVKQAYRVFYYLLGSLLGISTIACSIYIYNAITQSHMFEFNSWSKIVFLLLFSVYTVILIASGVVIFLYWKKHGDAIGATKSKYPNNLFVADFIQTLNNSYVFSCLVAIVSAAVLLYFGLILTGELRFYHEKTFLYATGILIGVILAYVIVFMIITMINNFIVERIKQKIQISDDLSDVADVMRSAQIIKDEIVIAEPELHTQPDLPACPDCGAQLPPNAATCPNCGCPVKN